MKKHLLEQQAQVDSSRASQDIAAVYAECHCPHIERWLPHILETATLPTGSNSEYVVENPVHALHLNIGSSRSSVLYGEEQKRADALWKSSGVLDLYLPNRLSPDNQHYYSKRVKIETPNVVVKEEGTSVLKKEDVESKSSKPSTKPTSSSVAKPKPTSDANPIAPAVSSSKITSTSTQLISASNSAVQTVSSSSMTSSSTTKITSQDTKQPLPTVVSSSTAPRSVSIDPTLPVYEMSEERFQHLRRAENQILLQRRNLFYKRESTNRKSSSSSSKKSSKKRESTSSSSSIGSSSKTSGGENHQQSYILDRDAWDREASRARDKVESWMQHFRAGRMDYWQSRQKKKAPIVFGAIEEDDYQLCCQDCHTFSGDDLMRCLDCGFVGCAPHSMSPNTKQHMVLHMLMTNHKLAVTCGLRSSIYCFGCGDTVEHQVFNYERERIDLEQTLPEWAWPEHAVQRSFDAFQFVSSKDHGIVWKGMVATYPSTIPQQHLNTARMVLKRFTMYDNAIIATPVGLYNLGNTCFMNGILQCLIHCPPFQKHFLKDIRHDFRTCKLLRGGKGTCLACEFDHLLVEYYGSSIGQDFVGQLSRGKTPRAIEKGFPIVPSALLTEAWKQPEMEHLKGYDQRDAHEFLQAFMDIMAKHTKSYESILEKNLASAEIEHTVVDVVKHLFEGTLRSVSVCQDCGCKRSLQEPFMNISLPLSEDSVLKYTSRKMNVQHCLKHFTEPEHLGDPIECPSCQKKTPTKKQQTFSRLPKILCLHLKRFDAAKNQKITDFVSFPSRGLDMGPLLPHWREITLGDDHDSGIPTNNHNNNNNNNGDNDDDDDDDDEDGGRVQPQVLYDLFGTVNHRGTLNQGHYVSHVIMDQQWYHCNDAHISTAEESDVLKSDGAYLLFYIRR